MTNELDERDAADVLVAGESVIGSVREIRELAIQCGLDALVEQLSGKPDHFFAVIEARECKGFLIPMDKDGKLEWTKKSE